MPSPQDDAPACAGRRLAVLGAIRVVAVSVRMSMASFLPVVTRSVDRVVHHGVASRHPFSTSISEILRTHVENGVEPRDFNSYGSRRGNHEVMMRGTFANVRLKNKIAPGTEGCWTQRLPDGEQMSIYDAAMKYQAEGTAQIVIAGKEYGSGSSRDWAAKGTYMLGVRAVIAESFERIHRSNLIGMGVLPLEFLRGQTRETLSLTGEETYDISGIAEGLTPGARLDIVARSSSKTERFEVVARIDTAVELDYYRHGGILQYVLRQLLG